MVVHIVMWNIKEGQNKAEAASGVKTRLEALVGKIEGLQKLAVYEGYQGHALCLYSELSSKAALENYRTHPLHKQAAAYVTSVTCDRAACDYEV